MTFNGHSRSSEMSRFDRAHMISYYRSIVTMALSSIVSNIIARYWAKIAKIIWPTCIQRPRWGEGVTTSLLLVLVTKL